MLQMPGERPHCLVCIVAVAKYTSDDTSVSFHNVILRSIGQYCCHKIWRMASEMIFSARWHSFIDNLLNRLNFKSISVMSCIRLVVFICRHTTMMC